MCDEVGPNLTLLRVRGYRPHKVWVNILGWMVHCYQPRIEADNAPSSVHPSVHLSIWSVGQGRPRCHPAHTCSQGTPSSQSMGEHSSVLSTLHSQLGNSLLTVLHCKFLVVWMNAHVQCKIKVNSFLSLPVSMHGGLLCVALRLSRLSVCPSVWQVMGRRSCGSRSNVKGQVD